MNKRINRESLLRCLESVQPGLSPRDTIEQSSCFAFKNGRVYTYNDEVFCCAKSGLDKEFQGAVPSQKLLELLRKLSEDEIELETGEGELRITGKKRRSGFRLDNEILLPLDAVEKPEKWKPLPVDFCEAVGFVQQCAGKDEVQFSLTCVHIHPEFMEACDNFQVCRWKIKTDIEKPFLIRCSAIKHISSLGMTEFAETESWVHFRNSSGLQLSCRRYMEDYRNMDEILRVKGEAMTLPKGLAEAADKAQIFTQENKDNNVVLIEMRPGKLIIHGKGVTGWHKEFKKLKYHGKALSFMISPTLLMDLVKKHNDCEVTSDRLKVQGPSYRYVACLAKPSENGKEHPEEENENDDGAD